MYLYGCEVQGDGDCSVLLIQKPNSLGVKTVCVSGSLVVMSSNTLYILQNLLMPRSWRKSLPVEMQEWVSEALFHNNQQGQIKLTVPVKFWYFPPPPGGGRSRAGEGA